MIELLLGLGKILFSFDDFLIGSKVWNKIVSWGWLCMDER
jgi:hypothetical protein